MKSRDSDVHVTMNADPYRFADGVTAAKLSERTAYLTEQLDALLGLCTAVDATSHADATATLNCTCYDADEGSVSFAIVYCVKNE